MDIAAALEDHVRGIAQALLQDTSRRLNLSESYLRTPTTLRLDLVSIRAKDRNAGKFVRAQRQYRPFVA